MLNNNGDNSSRKGARRDKHFPCASLWITSLWRLELKSEVYSTKMHILQNWETALSLETQLDSGGKSSKVSRLDNVKWCSNPELCTVLPSTCMNMLTKDTIWCYFFLKLLAGGKGNCSVGKVPFAQSRRLVWTSSTHVKSWHAPVIPTPGRQTGDLCGLLTSQSSGIGEF